MEGKVKTGIPGLDAMLFGGIPDRDQVLLAGGPGAGKTLLGFEYLYRNALMGESGILFALEEDTRSVMNNVKAAFPELKDMDSLIRQKKITVNSEAAMGLFDDAQNPEYNFGRFISEMEGDITASGATRIVLDTVSLLDVLISNKVAFRKASLSMIKDLKRMGVTSLLIAQLDDPDRNRLRFKPEYFMFDGIIIMYQTEEEQKRMPALEIIKMRGSKHSFVTAPYDISPSGFRVIAAEDITSAFG